MADVHQPLVYSERFGSLAFATRLWVDEETQKGARSKGGDAWEFRRLGMKLFVVNKACVQVTVAGHLSEIEVSGFVRD